MSKEEKIVFCTGGGCTAKLGAGVLSRILEKLPRGEKDPDLLVCLHHILSSVHHRLYNLCPSQIPLYCLPDEHGHFSLLPHLNYTAGWIQFL